MGLDQPGFLVVVVCAPVFIAQSLLFFAFAFPFFPVENLVAENRRICVCVCSRGRELVSTAENGITDIEMMGNAKRKEVGMVREEEEGYYFVAVGGGGGEH
jgi:hypothetical protein